MGLGKILRGALRVGSVIPGPWQIPAAIGSAGLGVYDSLKKPKSNQYGSYSFDPQDELSNLYRDTSLQDFNTSITNRIGGLQSRNDDLFSGLSKSYQDIYNNAGNYNFAAAPGFASFAKTGGLNPNDIYRMRGAGVFDEFAKTGGYTPEMIQRLRLQASAPSAGIFSALQRRLDTDTSAGGGISWNPGYSAQKIALSRAASREANDAVLNAESQIAEGIRGGRFSGAQALSGAEGMVADKLFRGKSFGLQGLTDIDKYRTSQAANERFGALEGLGNLRTDVTNDLQLLDTQLRGIGADMETRLAIIEQEMRRKMGDNWWSKYGKDILGAVVAGATTYMSTKGKGDSSEGTYGGHV
jgi:hypothetical protein